MKYTIHQGDNEHVIFHLHGTGGTSTELFSIGQSIDKNATLIGIDGDVFENGMRRYFARYEDLSFDLESLDKQTDKLYKTITEIIEKEMLKGKIMTLLGYSNGANIAINLLKKYSLNFNHFILFHPTLVNEGVDFKSQDNLRVLITYGEDDPFVDENSFKLLKKELSKAKIKVKTFEHKQGHSLTRDEVIDARKLVNKTT